MAMLPARRLKLVDVSAGRLAIRIARNMPAPPDTGKSYMEIREDVGLSWVGAYGTIFNIRPQGTPFSSFSLVYPVSQPPGPDGILADFTDHKR
jgi:hypothetical protein